MDGGHISSKHLCEGILYRSDDGNVGKDVGDDSTVNLYYGCD